MGSPHSATRPTPLTIGKLAAGAGVNIQTIRYYERRGLLPAPERSGSNYRLYAPDVVRRVRFIKRGQALGFSLMELAELLALRAAPRSRCSQVRRRAQARLDDIDDKIRVLQAIRASLSDVIEQCSGTGPVSACPILGSIDEEALS